jgi:NAD(P)H-hydrate epimerase
MFGRALLVVGSRGMSGAACLAGLGALRGGAGLVTLAVPREIQPIVAAVEPSYLTLGLTDDSYGRLSAAAEPELAAVLKHYDVFACGSGWGLSDNIIDLAKWMFTTIAAPLVIDADGLNALAKAPESFSNLLPGPRVLTPHPGEFARLVGTDIDTVQKNRESLAVEFAQQKGVVLLLKGSGTIVTDGQRLAVNQTGNSGMATGGTGDVLTGLITALLGQGLPPFEAAQLGAHLHGLAGDLAAGDHSKPGLIASDLPRYLGAAWKHLSG